MIRIPIKVKKHISEVRAGDTVLHNGEVKTLPKEFIKNDPFMGRSIWGDSYRMGNAPVTVIEWRVKA